MYHISTIIKRQMNIMHLEKRQLPCSPVSVPHIVGKLGAFEIEKTSVLHWVCCALAFPAACLTVAPFTVDKLVERVIVDGPLMTNVVKSNLIYNNKKICLFFSSSNQRIRGYIIPITVKKLLHILLIMYHVQKLQY
jgi:hypothetical protein